jgi:hypothetical protein
MEKKPTLCLIPSAYKISKLYSVLPADGTGDFDDFLRETIATRINKDGLIETVGSNIPRLNYPMIDGVVSGCPSLLLEPKRTNYIFPSNGFSSWSLGGVVTRTADYGISPDGTQNSTRADFSNGGIIYKSPNRPQDAYVFSVFAKNVDGGGSQITLRIDVPSSKVANFDLSNGTIVSNSSDDAKIENYGNGWYRCILIQNDDQVINAVIGEATTGLDCELFGAQLEKGSYPTSYIPTNGNQVTRDAETTNNSGDVNTFNDSEGVLFAEISAFDNTDTSKRFISILNGTDLSNGFYIFYGAETNRIRYQCATTSGNVSLLTTDFNSQNNNKIVAKYKANDFALWINGFEIATDTFVSGTPTGLDNLAFNRSGGQNFYGNTKQIQYFDTALSDIDLETLTSWTSFSEMATGQLYTIE